MLWLHCVSAAAGLEGVHVSSLSVIHNGVLPTGKVLQLMNVTGMASAVYAYGADPCLRH